MKLTMSDLLLRHTIAVPGISGRMIKTSAKTQALSQIINT
jgi:hypothetical protein